MKRVFFLIVLVISMVFTAVCAADLEEDSKQLDELLKAGNKFAYNLMLPTRDNAGDQRPEDSWDLGSGLVFAFYNIFDNQMENSFSKAVSGEDFYGIPNSRLAKDLASAETVMILQQVSVSSSSKTGSEFRIFALLILADPRSGTILDAAYTPAVYLTEAEKEAFNLYSVESCSGFLSEYAEKISHPDGYPERYDEAMALYNDEKYYSARQAFIESQYGNWQEMAEKCIRRTPSTGELWHDPNSWVKDMYLTFRIDQPEDTSIFLRVYKDGNPISYLFVAGPGEVTAQLPGNGYYTIRDGIGTTWYGTKEAFGREGSYEKMTFDESGSDSVYLQSYYEYTISINIGGTGTGVGSEEENYEDFAE